VYKLLVKAIHVNDANREGWQALHIIVQPGHHTISVNMIKYDVAMSYPVYVGRVALRVVHVCAM
jgi:hypothetical protein